MSFDFSRKAVLVTGGGQGIGFGVAQAFAVAGAKVHITGTRASARAYENDLSSFVYHQVRLENAKDRASLAAAIPALDVLVNNAGQTHEDEYSIEGFVSTLEVNLIGMADLCFRFRAALAVSKGAVVNIGSVASFNSLKHYPGYTASKAGALGLTRSLADEWAREGIRVNLVAPGFIETRMTDSARKDEAGHKAVLRLIPARRFGTPDEVAAATLFLAASQASYITGQSLVVDGGLMLR